MKWEWPSVRVFFTLLSAPFSAYARKDYVLGLDRGEPEPVSAVSLTRREGDGVFLAGVRLRPTHRR